MKLSKQQVARQFSRAAESYDEQASLQREMADRLIKLIPHQATGTLVDFGCGTGDALVKIAQQTNLNLIGLDIAAGMIEACRRNDASAKQRSVEWRVADLEQTGLETNSADFAFSNAAIQWCESRTAFAEMARVLKPAGQLLVSTFGSQTLHQWKAAWQTIGDFSPRVHEFESESDLRNALANAQFENIQLSVRQTELKFSDIPTMFRSIKKLGATNAIAGRATGLLGREKYRRLCNHFEKQLLENECLSLTFETITITATKVA